MAGKVKDNKNDWVRFVNSHDLHIEIPPLIALSWERCWPHISPYNWINLQNLTEDDLLNAQVVYFNFLSIARPIMEDIFQSMTNSDSAIILVNHAGYILDMLGEPKIIAHLSQLSISRGALLSEMEMGTNAFSLAITERVPVQVRGFEHYRQQFHDITEAAVPIFDVTGKPLGALGIINFQSNFHPHSLGLVVGGARAIEAQRQADQLLGEQNSQLARLNAILNTISEAILVWNREGILIQANPAATDLLKLSLDPLKGRRISDSIQFPDFITAAVEVGRDLTDIEANLVIGNQHIDCILTLRFVRDTEGIKAVVANLRQAKEIRQLIQRQVGALAVYTMQDLVGVSSEIQRVHRQVTLAAAARASVIIRGESGTGKNLLAQVIHRHSSCCNGPFIVFACNSLPSEMIVRELSGYESRSNGFEGESRPGKFELADGGTLFLQDVDALPLDAQSILLNVLEMGIVQRMQSGRPIPVDVRVIASSSQDLERLIEQGNFRPDLYYRLSPFELRLPPLRERMEDLPLLIDNILKRLSIQYGETLTISSEAMALLNNYKFPGNMRELESVIGRAVNQLNGPEAIAPEHLPDFIRRPHLLKFETSQLISGNSLEEIEREALLQSARSCEGNLTKMAEVLGISRTTLWRKLKQSNISIWDYRHQSQSHRNQKNSVAV
ncbi:MAG TPA: sigma 54-interacting transcriptional regulator [Anaerolineaceae bacterium]|nr:sigma 54-interacting transcriptional regulator [Anaerolineaceae bacterium]